MEADRRFRAMGTDVHVVVHVDPDLADLAESEIRRLEHLWSRFRPDSEITELTCRAGDWVQLSPETFQLVDRALAAHAATGGRYDPTVLGDVIRAGYDRSFEQLADLARVEAPASALRRGADDIELDAAAQAVRLPRGTGFDPGGIGKGLAADLIAERIDGEGAAGVLVNIGGDLRASGVGPAGDDWTVDLDPAATGRPLARVVLERGAVATSTTLRRRWAIGTSPAHHLIDPTTGSPANTDVVAASVLAAQGWQAEALAKAVVIAGVAEGTALVEAAGADALIVDHHGGLHPTAGFDRFTVPVRSLATEVPS